MDHKIRDEGQQDPKKPKLSRKYSAIIFIGLTIGLVASVLLAFTNPIFRWVVSNRVVLSAFSQGFPIWRDVSKSFDTRVAWYFFNLTNPDDFVKGYKPRFEEIGPFWYNVHLTKQNIQFFNENATVSFEEHRQFEFDQAGNDGLKEDVNITLINVPLMAAISKLKAIEHQWLQHNALSLVMKALDDAGSVLMTMSVRELTYKGRPNGFSEAANFRENGFSYNADSKYHKNRFGFGVDSNMTNPGRFNMYTGATGPEDLNRVHSMNGQHVLDIWPHDRNNTCNILNGTFGNLRPPMRIQNEELIFIPDMCRSLLTRFQQDIDVDGMTLRRFALADENFARSSEVPENSCYDKGLNSFASGVFDVGPCKKGAPILMSRPHFLNADPRFSSAVEGMQPDEKKHEFIMDHEPITGSTVSVRGRMQANVRVPYSDFCSEMRNIQGKVLPLFWQEMFVEAHSSYIEMLREVVNLRITIFIVLGTISMLSALTVIYAFFFGVAVKSTDDSSFYMDVTYVKKEDVVSI